MSPSDRTREEVGTLTAPRELDRARQSYRLRAWADAYDAFLRAEQSAPLAASDLDQLATVAYLLGRDAEYLKALERAHLAYLEAGEFLCAARSAFWLGFRSVFRGEAGQASGWFGQAQRLLEREADQSVEHGYVLIAVAEELLSAAQSEPAYAAAASAAAIGERFDDPDLAAMARHQQARARLQQSRLKEGIALFDETMVLVVAGRLSPMVMGLMYCSVVRHCQKVYALDRACEWTTALAKWCDEQPEMVAFSGVCRVHRAEVLQLHGAWREAVAEAQRACERARNDQQAAAAALYQLGEMYRLQGQFAPAEKAYRAASERGFEPQPGFALLRLAQGHPETGAVAIRSAMKLTTHPWQRARLLPACIEISLACGEFQDAKVACSELEKLARDFDSAALSAMAAQGRGSVELAEDDPSAALLSLRPAAEAWKKINAPYLLAAVRVLMGLSYRALGDEESAELELHAARTVFAELGATSDLRRVDQLVPRVLADRSHGLTARELEVLRLIASGLTNRAIAGMLFVSERTVDRHVSNIFLKMEVSSRAAATAYAYEHKLL
jgi:DNA-binding CsgD family transcriptional regulator